MKIKTKPLSPEKALALQKPLRKKPKKPDIVWRSLIWLLSQLELVPARFTYTKERMEQAKGPCLVLMNHSGFIDLKIASTILYPKPFGIVCTSDGFVGKSLLMRIIGCIPTNKFVTDMSLMSDMKYALHQKKMSVLLYPEASYSFDGTATPLPRKMGVLLKRLKVPVVTIITKGAFLKNPLYNGLQQRKAKVSAQVKCILTPQEIAEKSVEELDAILDEAFSFDHFKTQQEEQISVPEPFRADGLHRILYKCPHCQSEGTLEGKGIHITCSSCGVQYELGEFGNLICKNNTPAFTHIPHWYAWQRECVKQEIESGEYSLDVPVSIGMLADYKAIYMVGDGRLTHSAEGFTLTGDTGEISYHHPTLASYSLYADYYWYEIGDVICIGNGERLYYCFPKENVPVAKARLATEELYKINKKTRKKKEIVETQH